MYVVISLVMVYFTQLAQMVVMPTVMQLVEPATIPDWMGYTSAFMSFNRAISAYPLLPIIGAEQQGKVWSGCYLQANAVLACAWVQSQTHLEKISRLSSALYSKRGETCPRRGRRAHAGRSEPAPCARTMNPPLPPWDPLGPCRSQSES